MSCALQSTGGVEPVSDEFYKLGEQAMSGLYLDKLYEFAKPGDYIGIIRKHSGLVDFQISPHHCLLRDIRWRQRVVVINRVVEIQWGEYYE